MSQRELFYHLRDINKVAEIIVKELKDIKILLLFGELGAGKTTLTKHIIKTLGGDSDEVTSPTFNLQHIYNTKYHRIYHFDLYRIKSLEELFNLGIEEALNNGLLIFEWGELVEKYFNYNYLRLDLKFCKGIDKRKILLTNKNYNKNF